MKSGAVTVLSNAQTPKSVKEDEEIGQCVPNQGKKINLQKQTQMKHSYKIYQKDNSK